MFKPKLLMLKGFSVTKVDVLATSAMLRSISAAMKRQWLVKKNEMKCSTTLTRRTELLFILLQPN